MSKTYITTAIPYMNGSPHIGHVMDYLLADIYRRYLNLKGREVRLQAGTDEHGSKIFKKAEEQGISAQILVDQNAKIFQDFISKLGVEYTDFIRTTDSTHIKSVQQIWLKLKDHIYEADYKGWYCEGCERYITEKEYEENQHICPDHQKPYQYLSEKNYYLKISDFKDQIKAAIENNSMQILPEFRKKEILNLLEDSPDVSISRPKAQLSWGIPVPDDDSQVMYVWIDALANYITVLGYPELGEYWPARLQIVGKDILRFHAIIWPAILLGLGLELPRAILSHGHILANGQKMSKSLGNVINPLEAIDKHGLDAFRYYFSRHIDTFVDSDFTWEKFESAYNNELANDYGNLVQRLATLCQKNNITKLDFDTVNILDPEYDSLMQNFEFTKAIDYAWNKIQYINKKIDEIKPWELVKTDPESGKSALISLSKDLIFANHLLKPFLPISETVEAVFASNNPESITPPISPLFPKNK